VQDNGQPPQGCGNLCLLPEAFGNRKSILLSRAIPSDRYFARVLGVGAGSAANYDLEIRYEVGEVCIEDQDLDVAYPYSVEDVLICFQADHTYCFDHPGGALGVHSANDAGGDVSLTLRTIDGVGLLDSDEGRRECMYELNLDAGRYCVEVRGEAQSTYELLLDDRPCQ